MDLTINTFDDLLSIVNTNVEWRSKLVKALFPEIDVPKALQELAEAQRRTEEALRQLEKAQRRTEEALQRLEAIVAENSRQLVRLDMRVQRLEERVETGFAEAAADRQVIKQRLDRMDQRFDGMDQRFDGMDQRFDGIDNTLKQLKGDSYEVKIRNRATGIFGRYVKRGRDVTNEIGEKLDEAEDNGLISEDEGDRVLAADLLWGGKLKATKENVVLVVELSWWAEQNDVDRAENRAAILRRIGVIALPVVGGNNGWADGLPEVARRKGVVMMTGMRFDKASWKAAIDAIS